jgi:hypothetical protein
MPSYDSNDTPPPLGLERTLPMQTSVGTNHRNALQLATFFVSPIQPRCLVANPGVVVQRVLGGRAVPCRC